MFFYGEDSTLSTNDVFMFIFPFPFCEKSGGIDPNAISIYIDRMLPLIYHNHTITVRIRKYTKYLFLCHSLSMSSPLFPETFNPKFFNLFFNCLFDNFLKSCSFIFIVSSLPAAVSSSSHSSSSLLSLTD